MAEPVVILEPGEERAQKVAKAMASQTAGDILRLLGTGEKTSTEIAEHLKLPMNTVQYHTENLLDAGLISVASTKYSVKGREVKVYALTSQLLIVAPRQANLRSLLMKYASLFGIVAFGSLAIAMMAPLIRPMSTDGYDSRSVLMQKTGEAVTGFGSAAPAIQGAGNAAGKSVVDEVAANTTTLPEVLYQINGSVEEMVTPIISPVPSGITPGSGYSDIPMTGIVFFQDPAIAFFLGGACVLLILICYEMYLLRKRKNLEKRKI
jgi:DNA-binding transcriptional ArsR family regulator